MIDKLTTNRVLLVALLIMLLALFRPAVEQLPGIMRADLPNPDSFYKLVLVREYSPVTGFQYMARDNAPWGTYQHWSAVHSWTLLRAHWALRFWGVEKDLALVWAGSAITIFSMLALAVLVAKLVTSQGSMLAALVAVIALASSVPLHGYGQPNQITHHVFMLVPAAAAALCLLPPAPSPLRRKLVGFVGGALLALALWISPETMPIVVALLATRVACCLQSAGNGPLSPAAAGLLGMLSLAWWLDPPPPTFSSWALDHVSLAWLLFGLLLALLLVLVDLLERHCPSRPLRLVIAGIAAAGAGIAWLLAVPHALQGPEGLIPWELKTEWWDQIQELQPVRTAAEWVAFLATPAFAGILMAFVAYRNRSLWMAVLATSLFAYAALAFQHTRMGASAGLLAAIGYGIALAQLNAFRDPQTTNANARQQWVVVLLILAPILQLLSVWLLKKDDAGLAVSNNATARCRLSDIAPAMNALPTGTVLSPINHGPELLWRTPHRIIAGNYHHNIQGLLDHHRLWKSEIPDEQAIRLVADRGVDYVLACDSLTSAPLELIGRRTLSDRASAGERIAWLSAPSKIGHWWIYRTHR